MNVSGIRPNAGFYQYNSIKLNELRNQQIEEAKRTQALQNQEDEAVQEEASQKLVDADLAEARKNQTFDNLDFADQYQPSATYNLKGVDSDLSSLDMEKAISTMEKDQVLKQYQFFVRDNEALLYNNAQADMLQRTGENFML